MFGLVGVASTVAYAVLYLLLRGWTGAWTANALALLLTAIGQHRRQPAADLRGARPPGRRCVTRRRGCWSSGSGWR